MRMTFRRSLVAALLAAASFMSHGAQATVQKPGTGTKANPNILKSDCKQGFNPTPTSFDKSKAGSSYSCKSAKYKCAPGTSLTANSAKYQPQFGSFWYYCATGAAVPGDSKPTICSAGFFSQTPTFNTGYACESVTGGKAGTKCLSPAAFVPASAAYNNSAGYFNYKCSVASP
jgi:hypothetical protein